MPLARLRAVPPRLAAVRSPVWTTALVWITVLLCVAVLVGGCSGSTPSRPPNIVLIVIDTLRADHLGCYGYHRPTSPNIDRLAASGALFEQASSVASHTRPATASILTGLYPTVHGAVGHQGAITPEVPTVAELLSAAGYRTAGFHRNGNVGESFGFGRGFESWVGAEQGHWRRLRKKTPKDQELYLSQADDRLLTARVLPYLEELGEEPFFLYLHLADPHDPYTPPRDSPLFPEEPLTPTVAEFYRQPIRTRTVRKPPLITRIRNGLAPLDDLSHRQMIQLYDAEIAAADAQVGRIVEALEAAGAGAETVVIVTSDHGEEFFEHGNLGHGFSNYRELIGVPLVFTGAGVAARRFDTPVSLIDLAPTIFDLAGVAAPDNLPGRSLVPFLKSSSKALEPRPVYSESLMRVNYHGDALFFRSLQVGDQKLVLDYQRKRKQLFDLSADQFEQVNLLGRMPRASRELFEQLVEVHEGNQRAAERLRAEVVEIPEEVEANLRALGYVGGPGERAAPSLIRGPLRLIDLDPHGFIGYEREGAQYRSVLDFSSEPVPEQLLYGFGRTIEGPGGLIRRKAGARLKAAPEHRSWRLRGVLQEEVFHPGRVVRKDRGALELQIRLNGGESQRFELDNWGAFSIGGPLPEDVGKYLRFELECDAAFFERRQLRRDDHVVCLLVETVELSTEPWPADSEV